jgi:hypothetical protein
VILLFKAIVEFLPLTKCRSLALLGITEFERNAKSSRNRGQQNGSGGGNDQSVLKMGGK